jgi:hypothetical protein
MFLGPSVRLHYIASSSGLAVGELGIQDSHPADAYLDAPAPDVRWIARHLFPEVVQYAAVGCWWQAGL